MVEDPESIPVSDVYVGMIGNKDHPTIVGVNTVALALHRLVTEVGKIRGRKAEWRDVEPLCQSMVRDEIDWEERGEDAFIRKAARLAVQADSPSTKPGP
jgi:methyl coenzyme M reductase subunit C-like uncharacterized protein (methanogenesis marker protein 7)